MQNIVFYVDASKTLGTVTNVTNNRNEFAPTLVLGVSACLRMRVFATSETTDAYPISSFSDVTHWTWRMDSDFDRETPYKVNADNDEISVQTVTETVNGKSMSFTEFAIPISDMNTVELATWLGTDREQASLTGELVGYDSSGNAIFVLQVDGFTVRNRLAGLNEPTSNDQEYLTRSETEDLVSSAAAAKQDKLTSANAGAGIAIDSGGTISMACVILGATNGVKIADSKVQFDVSTVPVRGGSIAGVLVDVADGLLVEGGTASIDDASVADVLIGTEQVEQIVGGTSTLVPKAILDEVVTPGNLRGALSVGQAVDVSCAPYNNSGSIAYVNNDFLQGFTATMVNGTKVGFYDTTTHRFPKFADGLVYLFIANVSGSGTVTPNGASAVTLSGTQQRIWTKVTASDSGYISASANATMTVTNWRQYEVTALTDEAIAYIAQLPDPDAFFRSASVYSLRDKYLVKQDMVCPFIPTIGMPDNSDLTVGAGLSYKIKYTNDNAHKITVDTIPADAYGWDAHIQMFVKGTSAVQFQPPLVLMSPLNANAGHNLLVKFRNGQALVYVEDTDVGYIVISATGTTSGTLAYGFTDASTEYIVFGPSVDGLVCDFGTVTPVYGSTMSAINVLGNGSDQTSISGTLTVPSGKGVNLQDLTISGSTINGAGTVNTDKCTVSNTETANPSTYLDNSKIDGLLTIAAGSTVALSGVDVLDGTVSCAGRIRLLNGSTVTSTIPTGSTIGTGVINAETIYVQPKGSVYLTNVTLSCTGTETVTFEDWNNTTVTMDNVKLTGSILRCLSIAYRFNLKHCEATSSLPEPIYVYAGTISVEDSTISGGALLRKGNLIFSGENELVYLEFVNNASTDGIAWFMDGSVTHFAGTKNIVPRYSSKIQIGVYDTDGLTPVLGGSATITISGATETLSACSFTGISSNGILTGSPDITCGAMDTWSAAGAIFGSPLDTSAVNTVKLSGTTFTDGSLISDPPARIQIAAGTISLSGNTNAENTKILQAPVMVVGDDAAAPSGSATIVGGTVSPLTISGIGTWIDKEGDNDFRAVTSNFNVSNTASSGAGSLLDRLTSASAQATTSSMQQFVGFVSGGTTGVASASADMAIVSTTIMTKDYQPVLGGNYTVSSGGVMTVDQATKTATVSGAGIVLSSATVPMGATLLTSGGVQTIAAGQINGHGTFDIRDVVPELSSGTVVSGCTMTGSVHVISGNLAGRDISFEDCRISGFSAGSLIYGFGASLSNPATIHMKGCIVGSNTFTNPSRAIYLYGATSDPCFKLELEGCTFESDTGIGLRGSSAQLVLKGRNTLRNTVSTVANSGDTVIISSGAIVDLTGNTNSVPINPTGGIIVSGTATIINSAGSSSTVTGGTYSSIEKDGTIND